MEKQVVLLFGELLGASAGADKDTEAAKFGEREFRGIDAGMVHGLGSGGQGQGEEAGDMAAFFLVDPGEFVEAGDFARDLNRDVAGVEAGDAANAAAAGEDGLGEGLTADAVRTDHAHAGDDDAPFGHEVIKMRGRGVGIREISVCPIL